ncbi:PP30 [Orf virus]|uniref:PP30 n=1 Tax=Orf virus TaxID=10258 RepID=F1AXD8_ORFV|nr:PP30 [Orf virus]
MDAVSALCVSPRGSRRHVRGAAALGRLRELRQHPRVQRGERGAGVRAHGGRPARGPARVRPQRRGLRRAQEVALRALQGRGGGGLGVRVSFARRRLARALRERGRRVRTRSSRPRATSACSTRVCRQIRAARPAFF